MWCSREPIRARHHDAVRACCLRRGAANCAALCRHDPSKSRPSTVPHTGKTDAVNAVRPHCLGLFAATSAALAARLRRSLVAVAFVDLRRSEDARILRNAMQRCSARAAPVAIERARAYAVLWGRPIPEVVHLDRRGLECEHRQPVEGRVPYSTPRRSALRTRTRTLSIHSVRHSPPRRVECLWCAPHRLLGTTGVRTKAHTEHCWAMGQPTTARPDGAAKATRRVAASSLGRCPRRCSAARSIRRCCPTVAALTRTYLRARGCAAC
jgi:hypothetical protein